MGYEGRRLKLRAARRHRWCELARLGTAAETLYLLYRRSGFVVECKVVTGFLGRLLWHKAVLASAFDAVPVERRDTMAKNILKRLAERKERVKTGTLVEDPAASKKYPSLYCLMTALLDDAGGPRRVATLTVFADDGAFRVCLNERNVSLSLWAASDTLDGVWEALEARLSVDEVDWKENKPETRPGATKKGK